MSKIRILALVAVFCVACAMLMACNTPSETSEPSNEGESSMESSDDGIFNPGDLFGPESSEEEDPSQEDSGPSAAPSGSTAKPGSTTQKPGTTQSKGTTKGGAGSVQTNKTYKQVEDLSDLKPYEQTVYKSLPELKTDSEKKVTILFIAKMGESPMMGRKYGLSVETVVVSEAELINRYVSMINAKTPPDILVGNYNYTLISRGYVQAWDNYVDLKSSLWKEELPVMDNFAVAKKHYSFIPKNPEKGARLMYTVYNKQMIKEANLEDPATLYSQNKWDWDAFSKVAQRVSTNGNSGAWIYQGPQAFVNSTGHDYVDFVNGQAKNMLKNGDVTRAVQAYTDLVAKKAIYTSNDAIAKLRQNKLAMVVGTEGTVMALKDDIVADKIGIVAFPRDPKQTEHYMPYMGNGFFLAKDAKHPNNAVAYMVCWHCENDADYKKAVNKEALAEGNGTPEKVYDALRAIDRNSRGVMQTWNLFGNEATVYISSLGSGLNGGSSWSQLVAGLNPILEDGIRDFYGS